MRVYSRTGITLSQALCTIAVIASVSTAITEKAQAACTATPAGLVSWWRGESDVKDAVGGNHGLVQGMVSSVPGMVGSGFGFNGNGWIVVPDDPSLAFTNELTIELWYKSAQENDGYYSILAKRSDLANYGINYSPGPASGLGVFYNDPAVADGDDAPFGSMYETSRYSPAPGPGGFHHLAATLKQLPNEKVKVETYMDGLLVRTLTMNGNLTRTVSSDPLTIGAGAANGGEPFRGVLDEISIYNRVLTAPEIQGIFLAAGSGKCGPAVPPSISVQPRSQIAYWGKEATLYVVAEGTQPLSYLWYKEGFPIPWATNSSLVFSDVQLSDAGAYAVRVSNSAGSVVSSNAVLTVNPAGVEIGLYPGIRIDGVVGKSYGVQYTTNVGPSAVWSTLTTVTLTQPKMLWVDTSTDAADPSYPRRFYRVVAIP